MLDSFRSRWRTPSPCASWMARASVSTRERLSRLEARARHPIGHNRPCQVSFMTPSYRHLPGTLRLSAISRPTPVRFSAARCFLSPLAMRRRSYYPPTLCACTALAQRGFHAMPASLDGFATNRIIRPRHPILHQLARRRSYSHRVVSRPWRHWLSQQGYRLMPSGKVIPRGLSMRHSTVIRQPALGL